MQSYLSTLPKKQKPSLASTPDIATKSNLEKTAKMNTELQADPIVWSPSANNAIWVLTIGVGKYRFAPELRYADTDAQKINSWFEKTANASQNNIRILLDEQATKENVLTNIDWLRRHAMPEYLAVVSLRSSLRSEDRQASWDR